MRNAAAPWVYNTKYYLAQKDRNQQVLCVVKGVRSWTKVLELDLLVELDHESTGVPASVTAAGFSHECNLFG